MSYTNYAIIVSIIWAIVPILQKDVMRRISWQLFALTNSIFHVSFLLLFAYIHKNQFLSEFNNTNYYIYYNILPISFLAFVSTILYFELLQKHKTFDVLLLTNLYFIFAILINSFYFNEPLTLNQIFATILVIIAIFITLI